MRRRTIAFVFFLLTAVLPDFVAAQAPTMAPVGGALAQCTYDRCALRLDRKLFGGETIRVGLDGDEVRLGFSGGVVTDLVAAVPDAVREAEQGMRKRTRGNIAVLIGSLIVTAAFSSLGTDAAGEFNLGRALLLGAGGSAVTIYGGVQATRASQAFSRAIWQYNRAIPR